MMKLMCGLGLLTTVAMATLGAAQMDKPAMADRVTKGATYVGCVEAGSAPGSFVLTHAMQDASMKNDAMKDDGMMKHDGEAMGGASMPMASSVMLTGSSVSKKHLGHKVSVTGAVAMDGMGNQASTLAVKSLKVVGKSCP